MTVGFKFGITPFGVLRNSVYIYSIAPQLTLSLDTLRAAALSADQAPFAFPLSGTNGENGKSGEIERARAREIERAKYVKI